MTDNRFEQRCEEYILSNLSEMDLEELSKMYLHINTPSATFKQQVDAVLSLKVERMNSASLLYYLQSHPDEKRQAALVSRVLG